MQAPTKLLADRYRFKQSLDLGAKTITWIAVDEQIRRDVVASALPAARVAALIGVVGLRHPHLASICDVISDPDPDVIPGGVRVRGAGIVVAELVRGRTLHVALKQGPEPAQVTVRWWLGLCDAVRAMHQAGGAHGAISPRSVVMEPSDGRQPPVLTQLLAPSSGAYCAPERLQGRGPSAADDVWALHASLFAALTGSPPFKGDSKDQLVLSMASGRMNQVADFNVSAPDLQAVLEQGLTADLARRRSDVSELIARLEEYLALPERTVAIPGPQLHVPDAREWEEDAATHVQTDSEQAAALIAATAQRPAPLHSLPPVTVEDEAPRDMADDDDATTVMQQPPADEIEAALRASAARKPRAAAPEPEEDPFPSPRDMPIPRPPQMALPFDDEATIDDARQRPIGASEPPTEVMNRDELPIPPPPRPATFDAPGPQARFQPAPIPGPERFLDSGYPPAISSFPPPVAQPPTAAQAPNLVQAALPPDDVAVRKAGRGPLIVLFAILMLGALGIGVAMFLNYRSGPVARPSNESRGQRPATTEPGAPTTTDTATESPLGAPAPTPTPTSEQPGKSGSDPGSPSKTGATPSLAAAVSAATGNAPECVAAHFAPGTFKPSEKFDFLCKADDLRSITSQLHRKVVVAGKVTPGMRQWAQFNWYELGVTALVRTNCCAANEAEHIELPKTGGNCAQLSEALTGLTKRPFAADQVTTRTKSLEAAIQCLFDAGTPRPYSYKFRPNDQNRSTFEAFFQRAIELERK